MKSKLVVVFFLLVVFLSACSLFQRDSFEGKWELKLSGDQQETFVFEISPNYDFSFTQIVNYQGNNYDVTVKGKVTKEGVFNADLIAMGQILGSVNGTLTFENGSGKWNASVVSGGWTAVKK